MTGLVLAGGESRRMSVPKASLRLNDETFLEHAVSLLRPLCPQVTISAAPGQALPDLGCLVVSDEQPGLGPLGGLVSALAASQDEWHLALACDLPLVRPQVLALLRDSAAGADAVVPRAAGRLQPLIAAYSRRCLEPGREALASGERAIAAMLDRVSVKILEEAELRQVDPDLDSFVNVNTWDDYERVRRRWQERARCH